jgi:hypothetical protein
MEASYQECIEAFMQALPDVTALFFAMYAPTAVAPFR